MSWTSNVTAEEIREASDRFRYFQDRRDRYVSQELQSSPTGNEIKDKVLNDQFYRFYFRDSYPMVRVRRDGSYVWRDK